VNESEGRLYSILRWKSVTQRSQQHIVGRGEGGRQTIFSQHYKFIPVTVAKFLRHEKNIYHSEVHYELHNIMGKKPLQGM